MSVVDNLLDELCPDGVEYKPIGSFADVRSGATPKKSNAEYWENGTIPWMSSGEVHKKIITGVEKKITQAGFDSCSTKMIAPDAVVIALAGQGKTRGTVALTKIELCTNQSLCAITCNDTVRPAYLYHFLTSQYQQLREVSSGDGTRGGLNLKMVKRYVVPVPPIEIQDEIVRILDSFAELEAELEARKAQYAYYRDTLLNFERGGARRVAAYEQGLGNESG